MGLPEFCLVGMWTLRPCGQAGNEHTGGAGQWVSSAENWEQSTIRQGPRLQPLLKVGAVFDNLSAFLKPPVRSKAQRMVMHIPVSYLCLLGFCSGRGQTALIMVI